MLTFIPSIFSQDSLFTQEEKDSIITHLYSDKWKKVYDATRGVICYKIYESIPVLQNEIWNKEIKSQESFVEAMFGLEAENTREYAIALFDSLEVNTYSDIDSVDMKLELVFLLFQLNDYSKVDYLIYNTLMPGSKFDNYLTIDLWAYLLDVPEYEKIAKENLIELMKESTFGDNRIRALAWLENKHKEEITPLVISRFTEEDDFTFKWKILTEYLPLGNFEVVSNLLKESLITETNETLKRTILYYLLDSLRIPSNYHFVKNWLDDESSYIRMKQIAKVHERIFPGKPFTPDSTNTNEEIIDSTISYLIQSQYYEWIGDNNFVLELKIKLSTAKTNLQNGDSLACRVKIKEFQDLVDNVYKDSLNTDPRFVTIEGWKFLYWNAQYILDRLPKN